MQQAIDEQKMSGLTTMDVNKPPTKEIGFQEFPRLVYLHPKNKEKQHKIKQVGSKDELEAALEKGYQLKPHIPVGPAQEDLDEAEYDVAPKAKKHSAPKAP